MTQETETPIESKLPSVSPEELKELMVQITEVAEQGERQLVGLRAQVAQLQAEKGAMEKLLQRQSRLEALGKMAAGVAHEIRNPLGGIRLYTDLIVRQMTKLGAQKEVETAVKIRDNILALETVVSDMLDFTRELHIRPEKTEISEIIQAALELARGHECSSDHHVDSALAPATLCVDADQLQRVFLNIILNAFQSMGDEAGQLTLRGRLMTERGSYVVTFCDTGTGIPEDKLDEVFNPFVTLKDEGTGLGLAICHRVIEEHGGRIEVRNNPEVGVTFIVTLPVG